MSEDMNLPCARRPAITVSDVTPQNGPRDSTCTSERNRPSYSFHHGDSPWCSNNIDSTRHSVEDMTKCLF